jgi:molybdopterin synthase catalytic subunit
MPEAPWIAVDPAPIDLAAVHAYLADPAAGGEVVFSGTVRDHNQGRVVSHLEFEAYAEMAVAQLEVIAAELRAKWPVRKVVMLHRLGKLALGEVVVVVGVSSAHRAEAFEAARFGIDRLKQDVPIWKREHFEGGEVWVTNHP